VILRDGQLIASFVGGALGWLDQDVGSSETWKFMDNGLLRPVAMVAETDTGLLIFANGYYFYRGGNKLDKLPTAYVMGGTNHLAPVEYARLPTPKPSNPNKHKICALSYNLSNAQVSCDYINYQSLNLSKCISCQLLGAPVSLGNSYTQVMLIPGRMIGWNWRPAKFSVHQVTNGEMMECYGWTESTLSLASTGTEMMLTECTSSNCTLLKSVDGCTFNAVTFTTARNTWQLTAIKSAYFFVENGFVRGMDKNGKPIDTPKINSFGAYSQVRYSLATDSILMYNPNHLVKATGDFMFMSNVAPINMTWYDGYFYTDTPGIGEGLAAGTSLFDYHK
jgi:hypothetical protein